MDILLINAHCSAKTVKSSPPLGLGYLGAALLDEGHSVEIKDFCIEEYNPESVSGKKADLVGIQCQSVNLKQALEIAEVAKASGSKTIIGGHHARFNPESILHNSKFVDFVALSEGEKTIVQLAEQLDANTSDFGKVQGISYRNASGNVESTNACFHQSLDDVQIPARHLLPIQEYAEISGSTSIIASRGCSNKCGFCQAPALGNDTQRFRKPELVVDEIEQVIAEYGITGFDFYDDCFSAEKSYTLRLCDEIKKRNLEIDFNCETRIDCVDDELLRIMSEAGCKLIFFGIESGCQRILDLYSKDITLEAIRKTIKQCDELTIRSFLSFIVGLPEDDHDSITETLEFVKTLDFPMVWFQPYTPFPGTPAWNDAIESYGEPEESVVSKMFEYDLATPIFPTKYLSLEEVGEHFRNCVRYMKSKNFPPWF